MHQHHALTTHLAELHRRDLLASAGSSRRRRTAHHHDRIRRVLRRS